MRYLTIRHDNGKEWRAAYYTAGQAIEAAKAAWEAIEGDKTGVEIHAIEADVSPLRAIFDIGLDEPTTRILREASA